MCDWLDIITSFTALLVALTAIWQVRIASRDQTSEHLGRFVDAYSGQLTHQSDKGEEA